MRQLNLLLTAILFPCFTLTANNLYNLQYQLTLDAASQTLQVTGILQGYRADTLRQWRTVTYAGGYRAIPNFGTPSTRPVAEGLAFEYRVPIQRQGASLPLAPTLNDNYLWALGQSLFACPELEDSIALESVRLDFPADWRVYSNAHLLDDRNRYDSELIFLSSLEDLFQLHLFAGQVETFTLERPDYQLVLAAPTQSPFDPNALWGAAHNAIRALTEFFYMPLPYPKLYLALAETDNPDVHPQTRRLETDHGQALLMRLPAATSNLQMTLAREIGHQWIPGLLRMPSAHRQWFESGFLDYLALKALYQQRLLDEEAVLQQLNRHLTGIEPGTETGQSRGFQIALTWDLAIFETTKGKKGLRELLRTFTGPFTAARQYELGEHTFVERLNELGLAGQALWNETVLGPEAALPDLAQAGLVRDEERLVIADASAFAALMGR